MSQPQLRYHQSIFHRLALAPVLSAEQQSFIAERERVCGVRFPAAVTEWMSIKGVENLFYEKTNNDFLPSAGGGPPWSKAWMLGRAEDTEQGYLCVASENQAVVVFYVRLDEGEDPPVYHDNGEGGEEDNETQLLSEISWERVSDTYSEFIYKMMTSVNAAYTYGLLP